ncbi:MAG: response regulator transcription factor [Verrucomicrobia bacterium]|nr:response regulator transcription factor [Verrucomicrobiota bacterium]MBV8275735.1 response regulator transcription factor [Verrucomicrobiota bacterium]
MKHRDKHVFVVDDDKSVRTSLATLLESDGYSVDSFESAAAFLIHAPNVGPACLVLDVRLPGLDGFALQRQLAEKGRMEQIVFITGYGDIPMGVKAMKHGAIDFLPKPFEDEALLNAVAQAIARSFDSWRNREEVTEIRSRIATLTPREFEVFRLVIAGLLNKQIAAELGAALRTIKTHRGRVMHKLGVQSVADLVRLAQKAGVSPELSGP